MKKLLLLGLPLALLFSLAVFNAQAANNIVVLRLSHHLATSHPAHTWAVNFAKEVSQKSKGAIRVDVYPGGQMGGLNDNMDGVRYGTADMAEVDLATIANAYPKAAFISLPFLFKDYQTAEKFYDGPYGKKFSDDILKATNIRILAYNHGGIRYIASTKPINSLADLKLVKMRVPEAPMYVSIFKALGTNPTPIAWGDVYTSLQTGVVNAVESPLVSLDSAKVYEVAKYLALTRHIYTDLELVINNGLYQKLTRSQQRIIETAAKDVTVASRKEFRESETKILAEFEKAGVKITRPNLTEFKAAVKPVYDDYLKASPDNKVLVHYIESIK